MKVLLPCAAIVLLFSGCSASNPQAPAKRTPTQDHIQNLRLLGNRMILLDYYADSERVTLLDHEALRMKIAFGIFHIYPPDSSTRLEWRLCGVAGGDDPEDAAVSFLYAYSFEPFSRDLADRVTNEFNRIAMDVIDPAVVNQVMTDAVAELEATPRSPTESPPSISVIHTCEPLTETQGMYAIKARINLFDVPPELDDEMYDCNVALFFVFLPEDREVDLAQVSRSGFMD